MKAPLLRRALVPLRPLPRTRPAGAVEGSGAPPVAERPRPSAPPRPDEMGPRAEDRATIRADWAPGAEASLDGGPFEPLPIEGRRLSPGLHPLEVRAPERLGFRTTVWMPEHNTGVVEVSITPEELPSAHAPGAALVTVLCPTPGLRVTVEGEPAPFGGGARPARVLPVGRHVLTLSAPGFEPTVREIVVAAGMPQTVSVAALAPARGLLGRMFSGPLGWGLGLAAVATTAAVGLTLGRAAAPAEAPPADRRGAR